MKSVFTNSQSEEFSAEKLLKRIELDLVGGNAADRATWTKTWPALFKHMADASSKKEWQKINEVKEEWNTRLKRGQEQEKAAYYCKVFEVLQVWPMTRSEGGTDSNNAGGGTSNAGVGSSNAGVGSSNAGTGSGDLTKFIAAAFLVSAAQVAGEARTSNEYKTHKDVVIKALEPEMAELEANKELASRVLGELQASSRTLTAIWRAAGAQDDNLLHFWASHAHKSYETIKEWLESRKDGKDPISRVNFKGMKQSLPFRTYEDRARNLQTVVILGDGSCHGL